MSEKVASYLDSNAGAPLHPAVVEALSHFLKRPSIYFGNPSSPHSVGRASKKILAQAQEKVATSLGLSSSFGQVSGQFCFTSSGTEANQTIIRSVFEPLLEQGKKPHWILTQAEHPSVVKMVRWLTSQGGEVSFLSLDERGQPQVDQLEDEIRSETALMSLIWVHNETGVITDVAKASAIAERRGLPLHLDGAQAWGKISLDLSQCGADWVSFSGHKIGALAGVGVLWARQGKKIRSPLFGTGWGGRGGTENLLGILSLGEAAQALCPTQWSKQVTPLRDQLEAWVMSQIDGVMINGQGAPRVGNTSSLSFHGIEKEGLVMALDLAGFCVSSGAACQTGVAEPSATLLALGRTPGQAKGSIRVSLSACTSEQEMSRFAQALQRTVERVRRLQ
ncbi:MAG: cysteine desulfurase family protein [Bdellovibrionia bacterium]